MKSFILLLSVALLFLACNNNTNTPDKAAAPATAPIADSTKLNGTWVLRQITGMPGNFDSLYANKTPQMIFDVTAKTVTGNTGCNNFSGELDAVGARISFVKPMAMTKMFCPGDAEPVFLNNLQKITSYRITNDTALSLLADELEIMRFVKK